MPDRFDYKLPLLLSTQAKADKDRCFHFNTPRMITDTHDNDIYAQILDRNPTFFNHYMFSQRLAFNLADFFYICR